MKNLNDLVDTMDIEFRSHGCQTDNIAGKTFDQMISLSDKGYRFIVGNNPMAVHPYGYIDAIRVTQVNGRTHGKSIRTIWAVRGMKHDITLRNNFHMTEVTLKPTDGLLSVSQVNRARRTLCGVDGCTCGDDLGCRGPQSIEVEAVHHYTGISAIVTDERY